jgi:hypothetical protein
MRDISCFKMNEIWYSYRTLLIVQKKIIAANGFDPPTSEL